MCFSLKCCDFSVLCPFCCIAGDWPVIVYTHWHRGETERGQSPEYIFKSSKKHNILWTPCNRMRAISRLWENKTNRIVRVGTTFITSLGINIQSVCHWKTNSSLNIFFFAFFTYANIQFTNLFFYFIICIFPQYEFDVVFPFSLILLHTQYGTRLYCTAVEYRLAYPIVYSTVQIIPIRVQ